MADGFTLNIEDRFTGRLDMAETVMRAELLSVSDALAAALLTRARDKASGDMLQVESGEYLASLYSQVMAGENGVMAEVASNSPEAIILEYGGTIGAHDIIPSAAQAMRFEGSAGEVFAKVVHYPGAKIPARPVLHSSLDEMEGEIAQRMSAVQSAFVAALA